jgi:hypothetical protein
MGDTEMEKSPMMLYHACLNPWNDLTIPVYEIMPLNQLFLVLLAATNVACNLFLYRFLNKVTDIMDNGTRAFLNSAFADMMHCVFSPLILISGSLDAQRFAKEFLTKPLFK